MVDLTVVLEGTEAAEGEEEGAGLATADAGAAERAGATATAGLGAAALAAATACFSAGDTSACLTGETVAAAGLATAFAPPAGGGPVDPGGGLKFGLTAAKSAWPSGLATTAAVGTAPSAGAACAGG